LHEVNEIGVATAIALIVVRLIYYVSRAYGFAFAVYDAII